MRRCSGARGAIAGWAALACLAAPGAPAQVPAAAIVAQTTPAASTAPSTTASSGTPARDDAALRELFERLARDPVRERRFVERRHSALFVVPEESRGTLRVEPPSTFEKRTLTPTPERLRLDGEQATVQRGDAPARSVALDAHPALRALAQALRSATSGDLGALRSAFVATLARDGAHWRVDAVPRDAGAARAIERVVLAGRDGRLERIEIRERGGDRSELWLLADDAR